MRRWKTVLAFVIGGVLGFLLSQTMQSMLDASTASKIKRSMGDAVAISDAIERYKEEQGKYPEMPTDSARLSQSLVPKYLAGIPTDGYNGRPYVIAMRGETPAVIAVGRGGFVVQKREVVFLQPYRPQDPKR